MTWNVVRQHNSPSAQASETAFESTDADARKAIICDACLAGDTATLRRYELHLNKPVFEGLLPIHVAAAAGQADTVRMLCTAGVDLEKVDCKVNQNTALHFAVLARKADAVKALLDARAAVDPLNCVGTTPMHDAARVGDQGIIERLWEHGADWRRPNAYGNTILHRAALYGHAELVAWLGTRVPELHRRSFFSAKNHAGYSAYDIAVSRSLNQVMTALKDIGAAGAKLKNAQMDAPYSEKDAWEAYRKQQTRKVPVDAHAAAQVGARS